MNSDKQRLVEYVNFIAASLSKGFSYETDDYEDYRDIDGYPTAPITWLEDVYDIEYRVKIAQGCKQVVGAKVMVACGGPNVWVDTDGLVEGYWWGNHATARFNASMGDELLEALTELFYC